MLYFLFITQVYYQMVVFQIGSNYVENCVHAVWEKHSGVICVKVILIESGGRSSPQRYVLYPP